MKQILRFQQNYQEHHHCRWFMHSQCTLYNLVLCIGHRYPAYPFSPIHCRNCWYCWILVYLLCNYSRVVLHRRIVRADHIVMRAVRNTFCHAVVFISLITLVHFRQLVHTLPRYILYGIPCTACIIQTHIQTFRQNIPPQGRQPSYCCTRGRRLQYGRTLRRDDRRPYFRLQGSGYFAEHPPTIIRRNATIWALPKK